MELCEVCMKKENGDPKSPVPICTECLKIMGEGGAAMFESLSENPAHRTGRVLVISHDQIHEADLPHTLHGSISLAPPHSFEAVKAKVAATTSQVTML